MSSDLIVRRMEQIREELDEDQSLSKTMRHAMVREYNMLLEELLVVTPQEKDGRE